MAGAVGGGSAANPNQNTAGAVQPNAATGTGDPSTPGLSTGAGAGLGTPHQTPLAAMPLGTTATPQTGTTGTTAGGGQGAQITPQVAPQATPQAGATTATATGSSNPAQLLQQINDYVARNSGTLSQTDLQNLHQQKVSLAGQLGYTVDPSGFVRDRSGALVDGMQPGQRMSQPFGSYVTAQPGQQSIASMLLGAAQNAGSGINQSVNTGNGNADAVTYNGRSYTSLADLTSQLNIKYTRDPNTGLITINGQKINPAGYDKNGQPIVSVRQVLTASGVPDSEIQYNAKDGTVSYTQPAQSQQQDGGYMQSLMSSMPGMPSLQPYQAPDLSAYYNNLAPVQTQFNPDWNSYYNQAQAQQNPLTANSINTLMTKQATDLTNADEGLNAKGIFNSGIAVQMENQIRTNTNSSVATVLMNAQSQISKLAQTLYQDAEKQWNDGNTMALKNNQMWLTQAMDQQKQSFQQWLSTQQLSMSQANYALSAWDKMSQLVQKDAAMQIQNNQFNQTQNEKMYEFGNLSADQQAQLAQKQYQFSNLSADQQAQLAWNQYQYNNLSANQSATLSLDQQKLVAQVSQWAQQDKLDTEKIGVSQAQLQEKSQYDQAMIDKAAAAQTDTNKRTQLEGLNDQLAAVTKNIAAKQALLQNGQTLPQDDPDVVRYNQIMDQVQSVINPSGDTSNTADTSSSSNSSTNGYDPFSGTPFAGN